MLIRVVSVSLRGTSDINKGEGGISNCMMFNLDLLLLYLCEMIRLVCIRCFLW